MRHVVSAMFLASLAGLAGAEGHMDRGEYLVTTVMACGNCHTPMGPQGPIADQALAGRLVEKNPMFTAIAPNITPAGRVSDWSDEALARAIREGLRPDGTVIGPPMPMLLYRHISDDDLAAVVAYLRRVPAVEADPGTSEYNMPLPPAYGPPIDSVSAPAAAVNAEYGEYVAQLAHCMECHSPMTPQGPDLGANMGRGGFEFHGPWGTSVSANLTHHDDGLVGYSDAEIKTMITQGVRPDGERMMPPMPYGQFAGMTDQDLDALVVYLRALPGQPDL
ncbi:MULTISPECIES: c-type cytochrome [Marinovum]|nr:MULTISPECIES: c-type cytochrome [Marinovum]MDD9740475.1 c-type cytochrome [Marinovum sp. SP66]MDD9746501.1 c-type cytochrome [Marinovum sp. PR37]